MTLQQLTYIKMTAECGNITEAAEKLFISQPSLSAAIHNLEKEMGVTIFVRSKKGVVLTREGEELLSYAGMLLEQVDIMKEHFGVGKARMPKFSVSCQHYSFAVEAFIKLAKKFSIGEYELAVHETKTHEVIDNVKDYRSELGVLYLNSFNEKAMTRILEDNDLEFMPLYDCGISVYLSKNHPLAEKTKITMEELSEYPCLSFEQGERNSFYFAEEVFSTHAYKQIIKADDRATMLNLMTGLNGYTLCSGIICQDLNGDFYVSVPLDTTDTMTIGYIKRKNIPLSLLGRKYIDILKSYK